jgi:hypothetical protein
MTTISRSFALDDFGRAVDGGDLEYQLALYRDDAEVRVVYLEGPSRFLQILQGPVAIRAWLRRVHQENLPHRVIKLVDGGDRVAFTEEYKRPDGTFALSMSTAELSDGFITQQYSIWGWDTSDVEKRRRPYRSRSSMADES